MFEAGCWRLKPVLLTTWEAETGRITVWGSLWDPTSKITRAKWTGGLAQAVQCLFCKCEVLSSNPSLTKTKSKKSTYQLNISLILKLKMQPGTMAHTYTFRRWRSGGLWFNAIPSKKQDPHLNKKKLSIVVHT
jgi:hypothetical protein